MCGVLLCSSPLIAQFDTKKLLEDFSLQLFEANAKGFMSPLVIVANVGANDGFYNSAHVAKENKFNFNFSIRTMSAWVRDDQRTYTGHLPLEPDPRDKNGPQIFPGITQMEVFKLYMKAAVTSGELKTDITSATVFGDKGEYFKIPKNSLRSIPGISDSLLRTLPDSIRLTNGTNQTFVFAAVPQLKIGTFMSTEMLLRFIPPVKFDTAVGEFSFFGIAMKHGFTNWIKHSPVDAAIQISYQYSSIENQVGETRAKLEATTKMWSINLHVSRRFGYVEPYIGFSFENLHSNGSYTFTLPKTVVDQIGYDINPQVAKISLDDNAYKFSIGCTGHVGPVEAYVSAGFSKQFILGAGLGVNFGLPWGK